MGCDGGSISNRRDILVTVKKQKTPYSSSAISCISSSESEQLRWRTCALSSEPLYHNNNKNNKNNNINGSIVCCRAGQIYNREAILELLLDKMKKRKQKSNTTTTATTTTTTTMSGDTPPQLLPHINSIKDVITIQFTNLNNQTNTMTTDISGTDENLLWTCPVTMEELRTVTTTTNTTTTNNNNNSSSNQHSAIRKIYCIATCGHVMSDKALQLIKQDDATAVIQEQQDKEETNKYACMVCGESFDEKSDLIWLNPPESIVKSSIESLVVDSKRKHKQKQKKQKKQKKKNKDKEKKKSKSYSNDHQHVNTETDHNDKKRSRDVSEQVEEDASVIHSSKKSKNIQ